MIRTSLLSLALALPALAGPVEVSGDWITLADVTDLSGAGADRMIAATPAPGERLPLSPDFLDAQAKAAGFSAYIAPEETIWVTRSEIDRSAPVATTRDADLIPVLASDVPRGALITDSDIVWIERDERRSIAGLIESEADLVGFEAKRNLKAERPLRISDLKAPSVVRKGEPLQLVYQVGGIRLSVEAKAMEDAAAGEVVRVVNLQSNRSMSAVAWAPGEARVGTSVYQ